MWPIKRSMNQKKFVEALQGVFLRGSRCNSLPQGFYYTNTLFVHIPKCAGQAIAYALYGHTVHHFKISYAKKWDPEFFGRAFKFAVVRDPVQRYLSAFYYLSHGGRTKGDRHIKEKWLSGHGIDSFAQSLRHLVVDDEPELFHFHTQNSFLSDARNSNKILVDRVYRMNELERLISDFSSVSRLPPIGPMQTTNVSKKKDQWPSKKTLGDLREIYKDDYRQFFS